MKKLIILVILNFLLQSCLNLRSCPEEVQGKFICKNNPNAENYLLLNSNKTFEHFYKEGNFTLINRGTWEKRNDGECIIDFSEWKDKNENGKK